MEEDWDVEWEYIPSSLRTEYKWHLWFNNANTVQFPDEMFDYYAVSRKYGFIDWLVETGKIDADYGSLISELARKSNPINYLIYLLWEQWN